MTEGRSVSPHWLLLTVEDHDCPHLAVLPILVQAHLNLQGHHIRVLLLPQADYNQSNKSYALFAQSGTI